jgi:hypothetical protein
MAQLPVKPLVNDSVDAAGTAPQATVVAAGAVIVGKAAGLTVIILDWVIVLLQASVKVQLSVTGPPHTPGNALNVEVTVPLIKQLPVPPLLYASELVTAPPQATVIGSTAANTGTAAGLTVMILDWVIVLLQASVKIQLSVTGPPQAPGNALKVEVTEPLIKQLPLPPLVYDSELVIAAPQDTVIGGAAANAGNGAGLTVIILDAVISLSQLSKAVHVSVTGPPQAPGVAVNVDVLLVPLIKQSPLKPLL